MFTKNAYLVPQVSPSGLHPRVSTSVVVDHNGSVDDQILLHHYPDMFCGHFFGANNAPVLEGDAFFNQDFVGLNEDPDSMENTYIQPMVKRDRHSKIFTAQGPRDRRVRLSKGIARKFFDLQEMLGFDKPSKTLDWLLTKSKTAIRELLQTTKQKGSSSSPSECEVLSSAGNTECFENENHLAADSRKRFVKGAKDPEQATGSSLAKESRAKARERARARTREKMCIKQLYETREIQYKNNQFEVFQLSASSIGNNASCFNENAGIGAPPGTYHSVVNETENEGLVQESIAIKRSTSHQQSHAVSRDLMISSNYSTVPFVNATDQNWDFCSFTSQANLYAVWDQQKFVTSSTSNI